MCVSQLVFVLVHKVSLLVHALRTGFGAAFDKSELCICGFMCIWP